MSKRKGRGAPLGNKNASGSHTLRANIGGLLTGMIGPKKFRESSAAKYKNSVRELWDSKQEEH